MSPIAAEVRKGEARNANVHVVPAADIVTNEVLLKVWRDHHRGGEGGSLLQGGAPSYSSEAGYTLPPGYTSLHQCIRSSHEAVAGDAKAREDASHCMVPLQGVAASPHLYQSAAISVNHTPPSNPPPCFPT